MKLTKMTQEQRFPRPREEVFPFFSRAENLGEITPRWLRFRIRSGAEEPMSEGLKLEYRIHLLGIPMRWKSEISSWDPPHAFVDEQLEGPYQLWHHEHRFFDEGDSCLVTDVVHYRVMGGQLLDRGVIRPQLKAIFGFRQKALAEKFGSSAGDKCEFETVSASAFHHTPPPTGR